MGACKNRTTEATKGLGHSKSKGYVEDFTLLTVGLPQRGRLKLQSMLVLKLLVCLKPIKRTM